MWILRKQKQKQTSQKTPTKTWKSRRVSSKQNWSLKNKQTKGEEQRSKEPQKQQNRPGQQTATHSGFIVLLSLGVDADDHAHLAVPVKVVLEEVSQARVSVGHQLTKPRGTINSEHGGICAALCNFNNCHHPEAVQRKEGCQAKINSILGQEKTLNTQLKNDYWWYRFTHPFLLLISQDPVTPPSLLAVS